jgi:hypothetical protein
MTAEVEALLERLDSTARNKEHPMLPTGIIVYKQLAADASAVIGAQAEEIAKLNEKYATLFNKTQSTAMHASAPEGCGCSDCAIDQEACPVCYRVWWNKRHPNTNIVAADDSEVFAANRRAEAAEAKLAAAARQEQASYWMIEQRVNGCQEWLKGLRHHVAGEVVAIWTEFADHAIHFQSKQFAEEVGGLGVFVTSRLPCLTSAYITEHMDISANSLVAPVPAGDAASVQQDAERYRWLRNNETWPCIFNGPFEVEPLSDKYLDATVDAAMVMGKK